VAPVPKGPAGKATVATGSNAWSITGLSKVKDAAWEVMKVLNGEVGQKLWATQNHPGLAKVGPEFQKSFPKLKWEPIINQWRTQGRDYFITPDADEFWKVANAELAPMYEGKKTVAEAMKTSAQAANEVFKKRPPELR